MQLDYDHLLTLYEAGRFVDAYRETEPAWHDPGLARRLRDPCLLVLAGRLAFRLGGDKYGRWLLRTARARFPGDQDVRYFARYFVHRFRTPLEYLHHLQQHPLVFAQRRDLQAWSLASDASTWGAVRDFETAHALFARAGELMPEDAWVLALKSGVLLCQDRVREALAAARRAWERHPGQPWSAGALSASLCRAERMEEAATFTHQAAAKHQSIEIALMAASDQIQAARRVEPGPARRTWHQRLEELLPRLDELAPLADRKTRVQIARLRLEAAMLRQDYARARLHLPGANHPYFRQVLEHEQRHADGRRLLICHHPFRQEWQTCLPASTATVLSALGEELDPRQMSDALTYSGTAVWRAEDWLRGRGYEVTHFCFTPRRASALIEAEIPFLLHTTSVEAGHTMAVVGLDQREGTLLLHDPSSEGLRSTILARIDDEERPFGPHCTLVLPPGRRAPPLPAAAVAPVRAFYSYLRASELHGVGPAGEVVAALEREFPDHPMSAFLRAHARLDQGRAGEALDIFTGLLHAHPDCTWVQRALLNTCGRLDNTALRQQVLEGMVNRRAPPGSDRDGSSERVSISCLCDYADCLRRFHDTQADAMRVVRRAMRRDPRNAYPYHMAADIHLARGEYRRMLLPLRIATLLEEENDHFAWSWFDGLRRNGRLREGLDFLRQRAHTLGRHAKGASAWNLYIDQLEDAGHIEQALDQARESLALFPDDPLRLHFCSMFFARQGYWPEAENCLRRLREADHFELWAAAAVAVHRNRGDWRTALELCRRWVEAEPANTGARQQLLQLEEHARGTDAALELARAWYREYPGQEDYLHLLHDFLEEAGAEEERSGLLQQRVEENPRDGWAWRGIGLQALARAARARGEERERLLKRGRQAREQCRRLCPGWPVLVMEAQMAELAGETERAIGLLFAALDDNPEYTYALWRIRELCSALPAREQRIVFRRLEDCATRAVTSHDWRFVLTAAERFGPAFGCAMLQRLAARLGERPEFHEFRADVLLRCGRGADRGQLPESAPEAVVAALRPQVEAYPAHRGLRLSLVEALLRCGREPEAIALLQDYLRLAPTDLYARGLLAISMENAGRWQEARAIIEQSLDFAPMNWQLYQDLATMLQRAGNHQEMLRVLERGLGALPRSTSLRETAVRLLLDLGEHERALAVTRAGLEHQPDAAQAWHLHAMVLDHGDASAAEVDAALRKALELDPLHFEAADVLAMRLGRRGNAREALRVIAPFLRLPDYAACAGGRKAAILREQGKSEEAYAILEQALQRYPEYAWGWNALMAWIGEDGDRQRARKHLRHIPPAMQCVDAYRANRIDLLQRLLPEEFDLEREWDQLLADFPDSEELHLRRFDQLREARKHDRAAQVLGHIESRFPGNRYVRARRLQLLLEAGEQERALQVALELWQAPAAGDSWPEEQAWDRLAEHGLLQPAAMQAGRLLFAGAPLRPAVAGRLVRFVARSNWLEVRRTAAALGVKGVCNRGRRRFLRLLLQRLGTQPYYPQCLEAALEQCREQGMPQAVLRFHAQHRDQCSGHATVLGEVVATLCSQPQTDWRRVRDLLADWQEVKGMRMWLATNYLLALETIAPGAHARLAAAAAAMLQRLEHDHTAWYVSGVLLEHTLLAGDLEAAGDCFQRYASHLARPPREGEFQHQQKKWYARAFPCFQEMLHARSPQALRGPWQQLAGRLDSDGRRACMSITRAICKQRGWPCPWSRWSEPWVLVVCAVTAAALLALLWHLGAG